MGLLGVITSFFFVRYIDRRTIMLIGIGACGLAQLGFAIAWSAAPATAVAGRACVAFTCIFTFFYVAYGKLPHRKFSKYKLTKKLRMRGYSVESIRTTISVPMFLVWEQL